MNHKELVKELADKAPISKEELLALCGPNLIKEESTKRYQTKLKDGTVLEGTFPATDTPRIKHTLGSNELMLSFGDQGSHLIRWEDVSYCVLVDDYDKETVEADPQKQVDASNLICLIGVFAAGIMGGILIRELFILI